MPSAITTVTLPGGSNTQAQYNNTSAFGGIANATSDGTTMTLTSPKVVTNIKDTNANTLLGVTATGSAVNSLTLANSSTATIGGTFTAVGTGTDLNIALTPKGTGAVNSSTRFIAGTSSSALVASASGTTASLASVSSGYAFKAEQFGASGGSLGGTFIILYANPSAALANGDRMGSYNFGGSSSASTLRTVTSITSFAAETWVDASAYGSRLSFLVTPNTTTTPVEKIGIENNGVLSFGGTPVDVGFARNAAGVIEVNNGTLGTYKTLKNDITNAVTGFQINGAGTSGKILQGNGTNYVASNPTWPTTGGTNAYVVTSNGTNYVAYPKEIVNANDGQTGGPGYSSDGYLLNSYAQVAAGDFKSKGHYHCVFDMVKTAAGTATPIISVRIGTTTSISDTARLTFTFGAGTADADTAIFELWVTFRTVGSGTSAIVQGICIGRHNLATTGMFNNAAVWSIVGTASGGFDSSTATTIGVSFNGGTSFSGTNQIIQAQLMQP